MKQYYSYLLLLVWLLLLISCNDDFLNKHPKTSIVEENYFKNVRDLEAYTNQFYERSTWILDHSDGASDNLGYHDQPDEFSKLLRGNVTPDNVGGWDWGTLRSINIMLKNVGNGLSVTGNVQDVQHYIGLARYHRARFYIDKVQRYGNVPWYSEPLKTTDMDALMKSSDMRTLIVDSIMVDLDYAVNHMKPIDDRTYYSKWSSLALLTRFALYEGTFRKYHSELNLPDSKKFLEKSVWAAEELMKSGEFSVYNTGKGEADYQALFSSSELKSNKEMIFYQEYRDGQGDGHNAWGVLGNFMALSHDLAACYLNTDGSFFSSLPDNDKKTLVEMFKNRDPRMSETIMPPGFIRAEATIPWLARPSYGGYEQLKFYPRSKDYSSFGWNKTFSDIPIYRYAETLLSYAEAKAELGILTQQDLDKSVNLLRRRVNMPDMSLATVNANMDPVLVNKYSNVSGANKGVVLEIRRERRVEFACEGLRRQDILRWKAIEVVFKQQPQGMYIPALGPLDVTGDGKPDIAVLNKKSDKELLPEEIQKQIGDNIFVLHDEYGKETNFYLSQADHGYILFTTDKINPFKFEDKYYFFPIPKKQIQLNPNLKQPTGW